MEAFRAQASEAELKHARELANASHFELDLHAKTCVRKQAGAFLDLTGLAKGWAVDHLCEVLLAEGLTGIYVEWAGDIRVHGRHPVGRPWQVSVVKPPDLEAIKESDGAPPEGDIAVLELTSGHAICTSGDYMQPFRR